MRKLQDRMKKMSNKKFKLGRKKFFEDINKYLFRVVAIKDFGDVKKGDVGGWIEKESNLSQSGDAWVYGDAKVCEKQWVNTGYVNKSLTSKKYSFIAQIGIMPKKEGNILYKKVYKINKGVYRSVFDENFIYKDGKISRVKNPDKAHVGCSTGIHLSRLLYWDEGDTWIACEFDWKDVITVQQGKVRVKKCKVLGEVKLI